MITNNSIMRKVLIIATMLACFGISAQAHKGCGKDWKDKMNSEKIAFLTVEMDITPEEAQVFWPVYNQVEKEKDAAFEDVIKTYKALSAAVEQNADISKCLDAYLKAQEKMRETDNNAAEKFKAVLPVEKVAKLYLGEEKFRRQHIRKLHNKGDRPQEQK